MSEYGYSTSCPRGMCISMKKLATMTTKIHLYIITELCHDAVSIDNEHTLNQIQCTNFTNWINLCTTLRVTCNLGTVKSYQTNITLIS